MTIKSSGAISINDIVTEFNGTAPHGLNEYYRAGGLVPDITTNNNIPKSGAISLGNFYGGVNRVSGTSATITLASSQQNYSFTPSKLGTNYASGATDAVLFINSGVYLWSDSTSLPGLAISGWATGDTITIVNNGYIIGRGGDGGMGGSAAVGAAQNGGTGGPAISTNFSFTITNSGYICGGGGGGGGGQGSHNGSVGNGGGGGGGGSGGGGGGRGGQGDGAPDPAGGLGGSLGQSGTNGSYFNTGTGYGGAGGGGGGRVVPGSTTVPRIYWNNGIGGYGGQAGGQGGQGGAGRAWQGAGGDGGGAGISGTSGASGASSTLAFGAGGGGGGGWGASGGTGGIGGSYYATGSGGASGRAISFSAGATVTFNTNVIGWNTRIYGNYT